MFLDTFTKKIPDNLLFGIQLFVMLVYSCHVFFVGEYYGQLHFLSGVSLGTIAVWSLLLLGRRIAYVCLFLNVFVLFCYLLILKQTTASTSMFTYAPLYPDLSVLNTKFWMISFLYLSMGKIIMIMLLGDAVFNLFKERHLQLSHMSQHDALTGLINRRHMHQLLIAKTRKNIQMSLLVLDIDHFKDINDQYGHTTGDNVICAVASLLQSTIRKKDLLARFGGEEFLILLPETDIHSAEHIAQHLITEIRSLTISHSNDQPIQLTASVGVASSLTTEDSEHTRILEKVQEPSLTDIPTTDVKVETPRGLKRQRRRKLKAEREARLLKVAQKQVNTLIYQADQALLAAKEQGRNRVVVADIVYNK